MHLPVSSQGTTAFTTPRVARHTTKSSYGNFSTRGFSGLQSFRNVQASSFARHPGCSHRDLPAFAGTPGSRGFYFHAYLGLLPPRAVNMLAVRIRATDGMGTFTPQDSRPCRPLPRRCHNIGSITSASHALRLYAGSDCCRTSPRRLTALPTSLVSPSDRSTPNHVDPPQVAFHASSAPAVRFRLLHLPAGSPRSRRRIGFVILQIGRSPPVALHPTSRQMQLLSASESLAYSDTDSHRADEAPSWAH